jgi:serine O-acetyltransferase
MENTAKLQTFFDLLLEKHQNAKVSVHPEKVDQWMNDLLFFLFPVFSDVHLQSEIEIQSLYAELKQKLYSILVFNQPEKLSKDEEIVNAFFEALPDLRALLCKDIEAIYSGDPAAKSREEVLVAYPGFYAIYAHRVAHFLYKKKVTLIPRMIAKSTHLMTGIDIHPGARIGEGFCIDHGTGIVIGETTEIGNHVKIYQGVTLGALSVKKEDAKAKRHPTIGDHVVIYSGATILGGKTIIGDHSTVGGNVWLTRSLAPHSKVYYKAQQVEVNGVL